MKRVKQHNFISLALQEYIIKYLGGVEAGIGEFPWQVKQIGGTLQCRLRFEQALRSSKILKIEIMLTFIEFI